MKLLRAYLDGWRVLVRVLAFAFCFGLFGIPFALAVLVASKLESVQFSTSLYVFGAVLCLPVAAYLASWYSSEFRPRHLTEDEAAAIEEESDF